MTKRRLLALVVKTVIVPVLALVAVEAGLRVFDYGHSSRFTVPCTVAGKAAFCDNDRYTWQFFPPGAFRLPPAFAIPVEKGAATFRVFIVGESAAQGDPEPAYGFGRYLEVMLRERFPAAHFEIINTAVTAVNSHVLLPAVRDLVQHQGDLFLFYMGNNEVVGPFGPANPMSAQGVSLRLIRLGIELRSTRLWQLIESGLGWLSKAEAPQHWRGMEAFLERQLPADAPVLAQGYANFEGNLHDIVAVARSAGAQVLLSTVAVNLKDSAPFASLHRAGLGGTEREAWEKLLRDGAKHEAAGECATALQEYRDAAAIDDRYAELSFRMGRCQLALGALAPAAQRFEAARDFDVLRFRIDHRTNDIIRAVAGAAGPGVGLVDTEKLFAELSPSGVPGGELFYDHVHMNPRGNYALARALFSRVVTLLPPAIRGANPAVEPLSEDECDRLLALTTYDRARVVRKVMAELREPPFTSQSTQAQRLHELEQEANALQEEPVKTAAAYRGAIAKAPGDHWLHYHYGLFLDPYEPAAAAYEYRKSLDILPRNYAARENLAAALVRSGKFADAIVQCRELLRSMPYHPPAYLTMAYALARQGSFDDSIAAYREAMRLRPSLSVDVYNEIGIIETLQGHFDSAATTFQKALDLDSQHARTPELAKNLSYALKKLGRDTEAAQLMENRGRQ